MARFFRVTSSNFFTFGSVPISGFPFSIGCFFRPSTAALNGSNQTLCAINDAADAVGYHRLIWTGAADADGTGCGVESSVTGLGRRSHWGLSAVDTQWFWILGVWVSDSDRWVYVVDDGGSLGADQSVSTIAPTMSNMSIGRTFANSTATNYTNGNISHLTIWDDDFDITEVTALWENGTKTQKGYVDPRMARPQNIIFHWPGYRLSSASANDIDVWGGVTLTNGNSAGFAEDPPIQRQSAA